MNKSACLLLLVAIGIATGTNPARAQHDHLNAGAQSPTQDAPVFWANGADFVASSDYVKTLNHTGTGRFAGYFEGGITPAALPTSPAHAGPDPDAAAPGSFLQFSLACLDGPEGGAFGFWDATNLSPSISLVPGETSSNLWQLSESDGSPGSDPYGHIHGRRFTATKAGYYTIGFTAVDTSSNGTGGGPIHTPSEQLPILFQAGVNIRSVEPDPGEGHVHIRFGAPAGFNWQVEASTNVGAAAFWLPAGNPVAGSDVLVELLHNMPPGQRRFYRVTGTPIDP